MRSRLTVFLLVVISSSALAGQARSNLDITPDQLANAMRVYCENRERDRLFERSASPLERMTNGPFHSPSLAPRSLKLGSFFLNDKNRSVQPGCFEESAERSFTADDTIEVILETNLELPNEPDSMEYGTKNIPAENEGEADALSVFIELKVRPQSGPLLKKPFLRYYLLRKKIPGEGGAEKAEALGGPYEFEIPDEAFQGKIGFSILLKNAGTARWRGVKTDYAGVGGYWIDVIGTGDKTEVSAAQTEKQ